jgi:leader peptidase (prepilin peptidase) / N-methyltransferase
VSLFLVAVLALSIYISYIDFKTKTISDVLNTWLLSLVLFGTFVISLVNSTFNEFLIAWLVGLVVFTSFYLLAIFSRGAFGGGDVKFAPSLSISLAIANPWWGIYSVFVAFQVAAAVAIVLLVFKKRSLRQTIAFGPFLTLGFTAVLITNLVVA